MSKPELKKALLSPELSSVSVDVPKTADVAINNTATDQQGRILHNERLKERSKRYEAPFSFTDALEDAERLLKYAAEVGIAVDADVRSKVLAARGVDPSEWTQATIGDLLEALTKLAAGVRP